MSKQIEFHRMTGFFIFNRTPAGQKSNLRQPFPWVYEQSGAPLFFCKIIVSIFILSAIFLTFQKSVSAQVAQPAYWQVIMAEAVSDGYQGMYAVACVIRNRGGDLHGFCGSKRKDLSLFCSRQGGKFIRQARDIERIVFEKNGPDITHGATHFEAVERYGMPKWAKGMKVTARIGEHTFFKK